MEWKSRALLGRSVPTESKLPELGRLKNHWVTALRSFSPTCNRSPRDASNTAGNRSIIESSLEIHGTIPFHQEPFLEMTDLPCQMTRIDSEVRGVSPAVKSLAQKSLTKNAITACLPVSAEPTILVTSV